MNTSIRLFLALLLLQLPCFWAGAQSPPEKTSAFVGVNVIPMDRERVIRNQVVIVKGGKITEIGDSDQVKIPVQATVIAAHGQFLMPGLADMHAHLPSARMEKDEIPLHDYLTLNIIRGVTTLRCMRGDTAQLAWRDSIAHHQLLGPHLFLGSPVLPVQKELTARKAGELLDRYKKDKYDFVKYLFPLRPSFYDSLMQQAQAKGIKVAGHGPQGGLEAALRNKQASVEHLEPFLNEYQQDSSRFAGLMLQLAAANIYSCPDYQWYYVNWDQLSMQQMRSKEGVGLLSPEVVSAWTSSFDRDYAERAHDKVTWIKKRNAHRIALEQAMKMMKLMNDEGVPLLTSAGDGAFIVPGYSLMDEFRNFTDAGITPYQTLRASTVNPASFFGESASWGTVGPGKRADLLLLEEDPLLNIENMNTIKGVMLDGIWMPREELDRMQQELAARNQIQK